MVYSVVSSGIEVGNDVDHGNNDISPSERHSILLEVKLLQLICFYALVAILLTRDAFFFLSFFSLFF